MDMLPLLLFIFLNCQKKYVRLHSNANKEGRSQEAGRLKRIPGVTIYSIQARPAHRGIDRQPPEGTFQDTWDPKEQHIGPEEIGKQAHKHTGRLTRAKVDELVSGSKSNFI